MKKSAWLASVALTALLAAVAPAMAKKKPVTQSDVTSAQSTRDQEIQELKARLDRLERESEDEKIQMGSRLNKVEQTQDAAQWTFTDGRPTLRSGDGRFELTFRGRVQLDWANFMQNENDFGAGYDNTPGDGIRNCQGNNALCDLGSGAVFRRVRFGVEGKFFKDFIYELRFDFGGTDQEGAGIINIARVGYVGIPGLRIQAGALQPILTMYDATSSAELTSMERPQVVTTLVSNFGGDNGRRGVEVTYQREGLLYDGDNLMVSAAYTGDRVATNGTTHSGGPDDERTQLIGRLAYRLWSDGASNVQIGASGAKILSLQGQAAGGARTLQLRERPEIRVTGERFIDTGAITLETGDSAQAYGFEAGANWHNLYLAGEWYKYELDRLASPLDPEFSGWYVEGEWIITGEDKRYVAGGTNNNEAVWRGPSIAAPWSMGGGLGAWSLHARYSTLDLNWNEGVVGGALPAGGVRGGQETNKNIGITWYMNANLKMMAEYNMVNIDRIAAAGAGNVCTAGTQQCQSLDADFNVLQGRMMFTF